MDDTYAVFTEVLLQYSVRRNKIIFNDKPWFNHNCMMMIMSWFVVEAFNVLLALVNIALTQ